MLPPAPWLPDNCVNDEIPPRPGSSPEATPEAINLQNSAQETESPASPIPEESVTTQDPGA